MSKQAAELSHEEKEGGQDKEQCRLGHSIWKNKNVSSKGG
jgi:hypothetical protein